MIRPIFFAIFFAFFIVIVSSRSARKFHTNGGVVDNEQAYLQSIWNATQMLKCNHNHAQQQTKESQVCYPHIGCFSLDGPLGHTLLLPESPEDQGITFYAYDAKNIEEPKIVDINDPESWNHVNLNKRMIIIAHGFEQNYECDVLVEVMHSILTHADDVGTVIMVDWEKGANKIYTQAASNTQVVGRQIAYFVETLRKNHGLKKENVYLIGFSLGGQIVGFAGKWARSEYKWKFPRITGLDSAAPLFEGHPGSYLTKDDAEFVDGIHTSIGNNVLLAQLGFTAPYAHVDFYPNGGKHNPMCNLLSGITCNHRAAVRYFEASVSAKKQCQFRGHQCPSYQDFEDGKCPQTQTELGYYCDKFPKATGKIYLDTSDSYPYCNI